MNNRTKRHSLYCFLLEICHLITFKWQISSAQICKTTVMDSTSTTIIPVRWNIMNCEGNLQRWLTRFSQSEITAFKKYAYKLRALLRTSAFSCVQEVSVCSFIKSSIKVIPIKVIPNRHKTSLLAHEFFERHRDSKNTSTLNPLLLIVNDLI